MKLLVCVLNETRRLNELLEALTELGVSGATVMESQGMAGVLGNESPIVTGLRQLASNGGSINYTIFSILEDDELADRVVKAIEEHQLPGTQGGARGVAFTVPVDNFVRFQPPRDGLLRESLPVPELEVESSRPFDRAMLSALKRAASAPPGLVAKLADGLKALVEPQEPAALREKRRAPRVTCDFKIKAVCDCKELDVSLSEIGLFGLSFVSSESLVIGSNWRLHPPAPVVDLAPATVTCEVEQSESKGDSGTFRVGLTYAESEEALAETWIAHLLGALGYSMGQMLRRGKLTQGGVQVKAEFQKYDAETSISAKILDLGIRGALVEADVSWEAGTEVGLLLGPYKEHEAFYLEGVTVDVRASGEDELWIHGVRFYPADSARLERLGHLVIDLTAARW